MQSNLLKIHMSRATFNVDMLDADVYCLERDNIQLTDSNILLMSRVSDLTEIATEMRDTTCQIFDKFLWKDGPIDLPKSSFNFEPAIEQNIDVRLLGYPIEVIIGSVPVADLLISGKSYIFWYSFDGDHAAVYDSSVVKNKPMYLVLKTSLDNRTHFSHWRDFILPEDQLSVKRVLWNVNTLERIK